MTSKFIPKTQRDGVNPATASRGAPADAEAALEARTRELEGVMLAAPAAIYINDRAARRSIFINAGVTRLLGYAADEIAALPADGMMEFVHPDDVAIVTDMLARVDAAADGDPVEAEYRFRHKDGRYRWIADRVVALARAADGRAARIMGVAVDITERHLAQEALALSEARFRAVQETSVDGFMVLESVRGADGAIIDFRWQYVNEAGAGIFGRPRDWFAGRHLLEEHPGNREAGLFDTYVRVVEAGEPCTSEVTYSHDGIDPYVRLCATRVDDGVAISFADLTERRRGEQRIAASERRFRAAIDAVEGVLWTNSADGEMTGEQPGWAALTGQSREQYRGVGWSAAVHPDDAQPTIDAWREAVAFGGPFEFGHRVRRHDGEWRRFAVRALPVRDADGEIAEWVGVHTDLTERLATADALAASEERLRMGMEAGRMVAWDMDIATRLTRRSGSALDVLGLSTEGQDDFYAIIHPDDRARALAVRDEAIATNGRFAIELRVMHPTGRELWIANQGSVISDAEGWPRRMVGITQDITVRKTAELALAESEQRLRRGLEAGNMVAWESDLVTGKSQRSDSARSVFGLPDGPDDDFTTFVHPDDQSRVRSERDAALADGTDFKSEFRLRLPDGREPWVSTRALVTRDADGRAIRLAGITMDISARREAEAALASREADARSRSDELQAVLDAASAAIWIAHDPEGRVVTGNRFASELVGLPLEANHSVFANVPSLGGRVQAMREGRELNSDEMPLQRACLGEADPPQELSFRVADGTELTLFGVARPFPGPPARPRGAVYVGVDVTARKAAEAQLRATLAEAEAILEAVPAAVFIARDPDCIRIDTNRFARDLLRIPPGAKASKSAPDAAADVGHYELFSPEGVRLRPDQLPSQRAARGETLRDVEVELRFDDGRTLWILNNATPLFGADGTLAGSVSASIDISALKAAESALRSMNATLAEQVAAAVAEREAALAQMHEMQKLETIGHLTGGIAHDFNNLLTPIVAGLDMLQRRFKDDERAGRLLSGAQQSAERARMLVSRLLAFARRQLLDPRPVDIAALVAGMRDLIDRSLGPQIIVEVDVAPGLPSARVDPNQLELALLNLCVNARDAMPGGGKLIIAADTADEDEIAKAGLPRGRYLRLCVIDTGVGMTRETLQRAIEPFYTTKGIGKGTGLGLSMVHGLAAQSGGALHLVSAPDEGTTATIWLPASAEADTAAGAPAIADLPATRPLAVLLVDDDEPVREVAAEMLHTLGHRVTQVASGPDALAALREDDGYDLLLTDYLMPGMNGAELVAAARALRPGLPAALVTGFAKLAVDEVVGLPRLHKPFRAADLASLIAETADTPSVVRQPVRSPALP